MSSDNNNVVVDCPVKRIYFRSKILETVIVYPRSRTRETPNPQADLTIPFSLQFRETDSGHSIVPATKTNKFARPMNLQAAICINPD